jgi:plasmid stabilization system protein ParE
VKLRLGKRLLQQVEHKDAWWAKNRLAAPELFARELRDTLEHIRTQPGSGVGWPTARRPTLRRILMPRTQNHIFFLVNEKDQTVDVLAIWGAPRDRMPPL